MNSHVINLAAVHGQLAKKGNGVLIAGNWVINPICIVIV